MGCRGLVNDARGACERAGAVMCGVKRDSACSEPVHGGAPPTGEKPHMCEPLRVHQHA